MGKRIISAAACIFLVFIIISISAGKEPDGRVCTSILQSLQESKCFADSMTGRQYGAVNDLVQKNVINQKEDMQDHGWKIEPDAPEYEAIGSNLISVGHSTEGNGCVYTTNRRYFGNEQEDNNMTIYRTKEKQWEVVVSYPEPSLSGLLDGEGGVIYDRYIWDLTYYKGYVYYILVDDYAPGEGIGKEYYLCRVSVQSGQEEKLGGCFSKFYIYNDKIYYMTQNAQEDIRFFWEMTLDGSYIKLVHCQKPGHCSRTGRDFAVGGDSLYWAEDKNGIRAINLETKKEKFFAVNLDYGIDGIYYANGNLYIDEAFIYQLDLNSGDIRKIIDTRRDAIWIYNEYLYYVVHTENENYYKFYFWRRDLLTNEVIKWYEIEIPRNDNLHVPIIHLESAGNNILVKMETHCFPENEDEPKYEYSYFMKSLDEIDQIESGMNRGDRNLKEGLNGTKAERRKFEGYDESNIMYPYIILDNCDLQNQINRQISEAITEYCGDPTCSYEVDYEIKCFNQEYLSILFEGIQFPLGLAHPSDIAWGITFDMKSGNKEME